MFDVLEDDDDNFFESFVLSLAAESEEADGDDGSNLVAGVGGSVHVGVEDGRGVTGSTHLIRHAER